MENSETKLEEIVWIYIEIHWAQRYWK